jgi:hypothetical protein
MASLTTGDPGTTIGGATTSAAYPAWLQDLIKTNMANAAGVAGQPWIPYQANTAANAGISTAGTTAPLADYQKQAYQQVSSNQGNWTAGLNDVNTGFNAAAGATPVTTAGAPNTLNATNLDPSSAFKTYADQATANSGLTAAQSYLGNANKTSVNDISSYMNPYTSNVTDMIAKLGARNLSENLLPALSDSFVKAGQFGGTRMGEFGSRALRDTQDSILNQQNAALQSGYTQALTASKADLDRQAQLASTAGQLGTAGQTTLANLGATAGSMTKAQQDALLRASELSGTQAGTDATSQQAALSRMAALNQQRQTMGYTDAAALEAAGKAQQAAQQAQLTDSYNQWLASQGYGKEQVNWLSGQLGTTATTTPQTKTVAETSTITPAENSTLATALGTTAAGLGVLQKLQDLGWI